MPEQREEGWYHDPYGVHEARWFSDGEPTKLVRDGEDEAYDDPPEGPPPERPRPFEAAGFDGGEDLHRADETAPPGFDRSRARLAGEAAVGEGITPFPLNRRD